MLQNSTTDKNDPDFHAELKIQMLADEEGSTQEQMRDWITQEAVNKRGLSFLIEQGFSARLNVIFDIDHTLIYAFDRHSNPSFKPDPATNSHLLRLDGPIDMNLVVRSGVTEMLDKLSSFCTLYAYSHGLKEYVLKILDKVDPQCKYFLSREDRVLAPIDQMQQQQFRHQGKKLSDLNRCGKRILSDADLDRAIIIDDQYAAISESDRGFLVLSKKFLNYSTAPMSKQKQDELQTYQYPNHSSHTSFYLIPAGQNLHDRSYLTTDGNQLSYICLLIQRVFLLRFLDKKPLYQIIQSYRKQILAGLSFSFDDFDLGISEPLELAHVANMKVSLLEMIRQMGGDNTKPKPLSDVWVFYQNNSSTERVTSPMGIKVRFEFITECYFSFGLFDTKNFEI